MSAQKMLWFSVVGEIQIELTALNTAFGTNK